MLAIVTSGLILAAGLGTRLRPLTEHIAKPLLPIGNRSVLAHIASSMSGCALDAIAVNAYFRSNDVAREADALGLVVSFEDKLLGTAGGVRKAWTVLAGEKPVSNILVATGDVLTGASFAPLLDLEGVDASLLIEPLHCGEGNVGIDRDGLVVRFRNEVLRKGEVAGGFSLGVQCLSSSMWAHLPKAGCLVADLYMPRIRMGTRVRAHSTLESWRDIGTLENYMAANLDLLEGRPAWVGANSTTAGATLDRVIVGESASLVAGVYRRCVVLPGATVTQPGEDRIYWGDTFVQVH